MTTETIYNPDTRFQLFEHGDKRPRFTHFTTEYSDPLTSSPHPIIQKLIENGWTVGTTFTRYFFGFPAGTQVFSGHFVMEERAEFEIRVPDKCWLRFRFDGPKRAYLSLYYVEFAQQGRGIGREFFPKIIDALFRAGINYVWGIVTPPYHRVAWPMNQERLIRFYEKNGFSNIGDERVWKFSPYRASDDDWTGDTATVVKSETAPVVQS